MWCSRKGLLLPFNCYPGDGRFQGNSSVECQVFGFVDDAHSALAKLLEDFVVRYGQTDEGNDWSFSSTGKDAHCRILGAVMYSSMAELANTRTGNRPLFPASFGVVFPEWPAYPNPFLLNQQSAVYIPANAAEGDLTIYSSGMDLVYRSHQQLTSRLGQQVFAWDGRTSSGNVVNSGIYVFVLGLGNRTVKGKIAILRR